MNQNNSLCCKTATIDQLREAVANRTPISSLHGILTHPGAHMDELLAMFYIIKTPQGKKLFVPTEEIKCGFITQAQIKQWKGEEGFYKALQGGYVLIGTGGGLFDEHVDRSVQISCAQLVADYLQLLKNTAGNFIHRPLLDYVNYEDNKGNTLYEKCNDFANLLRPALIADNVKNGWTCVRAGLKDPYMLIAEVFGYIENSIGHQQLFFDAKEDYKSGEAKKMIVPLDAPKEGKGKTPALVVVHSDNPLMSSVVRMIMKANQEYVLKILMIVNSKGQMYISSLNGIKLVDVIKVLRVELARRKRVQFPEWDVLDTEGELAGVQELYYHKEAESIMNGSLTQPDVPGVIGKYFTTEKVIELISIAVSKRFHPEFFASHCAKKKCARHECPWYSYGLTVCTTMRTPVVSK